MATHDVEPAKDQNGPEIREKKLLDLKCFKEISQDTTLYPETDVRSSNNWNVWFPSDQMEIFPSQK